MDPIRNPHVPGAGSGPPALAGRDAELKAFRVLLERLRRGRPDKSMIITGLRGVGKTVLLNTFRSIAEQARFVTAFTEITHETEFRPLMARLIRRALLSLSPVNRMKDRARPAVLGQLDENFFRVRVARCANAELEYLRAMAALGDGPYRSGDIATKMGRPGPQNVAPARSRLIEKGLIFSPSYGQNEFTVPQFADFMRRDAPAR